MKKQKNKKNKQTNKQQQQQYAEKDTGVCILLSPLLDLKQH